jgi:hypothetical protein
MEVCHVAAARFDDPNLVSCAGLAPVMSLARRCGLGRLVAERLTLTGDGVANPAVKVACLVAGMVAGADSIDDMDLLRHGAMGRLFGGLRAPSTLGTFLRGLTFGHVRQLDAVAAGLLANLAAHTPLLPGADQIAWVDADDTMRGTHGHAKQGVGYGYTGVQGLNALIATVSTPLAAPVICATRLRKGSTKRRPAPRAAHTGWSPTRSGPRRPRARPGWSWSGRTRRSTATRWSPRPAARVQGSRSPPG